MVRITVGPHGRLRAQKQLEAVNGDLDKDRPARSGIESGGHALLMSFDRLSQLVESREEADMSLEVGTSDEEYIARVILAVLADRVRGGKRERRGRRIFMVSGRAGSPRRRIRGVRRWARDLSGPRAGVFLGFVVGGAADKALQKLWHGYASLSLQADAASTTLKSGDRSNVV